MFYLSVFILISILMPVILSLCLSLFLFFAGLMCGSSVRLSRQQPGSPLGFSIVGAVLPRRDPITNIPTFDVSLKYLSFLCLFLSLSPSLSLFLCLFLSLPSHPHAPPHTKQMHRVTFISTVTPNSPAAQAGLATGQQILELDAKDCDDLSVESVQALLDANSGTVNIKVAMTHDLRRLQCHRRKIELEVMIVH